MMNSKNLLVGAAALAVLAISVFVIARPWSPLYPQTPIMGGSSTQPGFPSGGMGGPMTGQPRSGPGSDMGPGMGGPWGTGGPYTGTYAEISMDDAIESFRQYIRGIGSNLELLEVMEFQHNFYAAVKEKDTGMGAFELLLWKGNGRITPEPGPNMMWNLKYGMRMARSYGDYAPTLGEDDAREMALASLRKLFPGSEVNVEEAIPFYGYYTFDYSVDGRMTGMLSVNAFSGEIWYHTWHGYFIGMREVED